MRTGKMDVRIRHAPDAPGELIRHLIAEVVDARLARNGERLVHLVDQDWRGAFENIASPWVIYTAVAYEAEPRT